MTVKFVLLVTAAPYSQQACESAWQFAHALLTAGHHLQQVFFYQDGVLAGNRLITPPQDEPNVPARWASLAQQYQLDLVICTAAAQRRGLLDDALAGKAGISGALLAQGFRIAGLGQFVEAYTQADRCLVFRA